jgi:hypothetical protein
MISIDEELAQRGIQDMTQVIEISAKPVAIWPSQRELRDLHASVVEKFPELACIGMEMFESAFRAASLLHRQPKINTQFDWQFWTRLANERRFPGDGEFIGLALILALIAWGDVELVDWRLYHQGIRPAYNLNQFVGRLPTDSWRKVLAGEFIAPIDPRPRSVRGQPVPKVSILVDGKPLPVQRHQGPAYWGQ